MLGLTTIWTIIQYTCCSENKSLKKIEPVSTEFLTALHLKNGEIRGEKGK